MALLKPVSKLLSVLLAILLVVALAYGYLFAIYGIIYSSLPILRMPVNGLIGTLLTNADSVLIGSAFFAILFGIVAALVQSVALGLVYAFSRFVNRANSPNRGAWIGLCVSLGLIVVIQLLFHAGSELLLRLFWQSSYLFWWGLPSLIFVALTTWIGWKVRFGNLLKQE